MWDYRDNVFGFYNCKSTSAWNGSVKKNGKQSLGKSRGGLTTKIHVLATSERTAYAISLSGGEAHDGPEGENLLVAVGERPILTDLAMDKAYSGVNIRIISETLNFNPIVPPKSNSKEPWDYDKENISSVTKSNDYLKELNGVSVKFLLAMTN